MCLTKKNISAGHDADRSDADCAFLGSIQLLVVYRPPSSSLPRAFLDDFTQLLNNVANTVNETIICGDFNIKYNTQSTVNGLPEVQCRS